MAENTWEKVGDWQDDSFFDDKYSYVDDHKNIVLDESQININQESNSQLVPFELPRYSDGIDLSEMVFSINYINPNNQFGSISPIHIRRSDDKIRFDLLVPPEMTQVVGNVQFEIIAVGVVNVGGQSKDYCWRTNPLRKGFNILESLNIEDTTGVEPSSGWESYMIKILTSLQEANQAKRDAENAAAEAQQTFEDVNLAIMATVDRVADKVQDRIKTARYDAEQQMIIFD